MSTIICILSAIGALTAARWAREAWRTRRDKGYKAGGGAF
jgi:hypothetical protein